MVYISTILYVLSHLALTLLILLLRNMGKRLGRALEMPPYHRLYLVSAFLLLLPFPVYLALLLMGRNPFSITSYQTVLMAKVLVALLPSAVGLTVALYPTARYWKWIWKELERSEGEG